MTRMVTLILCFGSFSVYQQPIKNKMHKLLFIRKSKKLVN
jgi:hypothetical protein